ncbi:MAG: RdgB/HAM1 family non-canonical purine NTP pyrophosphatase [Actinobacteria bacterium]|nr:RdgB/HAM1 family non-canonical purine NTP pyrophosphatase [Actinomycetota bacterium]NBY15218.1 RdgB/HAM1 family non-canonical purine NTP pyrophosphatase [Actinomycetota bacterium]
MTTQIVLATRNLHKADELGRILATLNLDIEVLTVANFPAAPEVEETEVTFVGNALLKARALVAHTGLPAIADDSGLCVDALAGAPGVLSARWSGASENIDQANMDLVLKQLVHTPDEQRGAQFVCAAVLVLPDGTEVVRSGLVNGDILRTPRGTQGFGYDPIFQPTGFTQTTAELSPEEKDAISHRGQALRQLAQAIKELI